MTIISKLQFNLPPEDSGDNVLRLKSGLRNGTILNSGLESARELLKSLFSPEDQDKVNNINSIQVVNSPDFQPNDIKLEPTEGILKLGSNVGRNVFEALQELEKSHEPGNENKVDSSYVSEQTNRFPDLLPHEEDAQKILLNTNAILSRAYNRRTNMPAWILNLVIKKMGFSEGGYEPLQRVLTSDSGFIKVFAEYLKLKKEKGSAEAKQLLESAFRGDVEAEQKKKLVKLSSFVVSYTTGFASKFVSIFPIIFSVQNIAMPLFARAFKGTFGKVFDFVRLINPWVGDFLAEILGNFKQEIQEIKSVKNNNKSAMSLDEKTENVIGEIKLTELTSDEHKLQQVVKKVNEGFERLFGKNNTLSSWFLNGVLWMSGKEVNYQKFASKFVDNPLFIKKLYAYLKSGAKEPFNGSTEEKIVANIVLKVVSLAKSMSPSFIENVTNAFGLPYSIQNLTMPILAKFVTEGKLSTLIHFLRDVNPIINDLFVDHIGNFRKEITDIQKEPIVDELFPSQVVDVEGVKGGIVQSIKSLWQTIRDFGKRVTGRGVIIEPEVTPS